MIACKEMAIGYNLSMPPRSQLLATITDDHHDMNKFLPLIAVLALSGCATSETTYLKNGEQGLSIDCSGEANAWASCYEKADASCAGTGYRIVGTDGTPSTKESDKTLGADVGNYKNRSVVVVCK
ncbi:hypothetical protein PMI30_04706 [Pseudomonas sp. GM50]|nr:hypothetical protein PMI30_04706 [Pseudomonas sp. GM50]